MQRRGELHRMMMVELSQGEEYAKRLQRMLLDPALPPLSSVRSSSEEEASLINKVLSSFDIVLSLLKSSSHAPRVTDSSLSVGIRPSSRTYHKNSGSPLVENGRQKVSKKRKALPKSTAQVNLGLDAGTEELMEDGYVWRKYGQKEILGSAHPREYYRCRHKYDHGCEATKHVQRSDENPSVFNITYRGKHSCNESNHLSPAARTMALCNSPENQHSFDLPQNFEPESQQYCSLDPPMISVSPPFFSPATTSDSSHYIFSGGIEQPNPNNSESDFTEIISGMTSAPNSPLPDFECLETLCLDHDLLFDEQFFK